MKEEKLLLEGIYAMIEELRGNTCHPAASPTNSTVDLSGIEMLIKHWKTQSLEQVVNMEKSLTTKLDSFVTIANKTTNSDKKIDNIIEILQQLPSKPQAQAQKHHHVIDLKSSKTVRYILIQWMIIILFLGFSIWQTDKNMALRDNDLKYRYIKSVNSSNKFIQHLEQIFNYDRDKNEIKKIKERVKKYEDEANKRTEKIVEGKQND